MQRLRLAPAHAGGLADERRLGPFFEDDERVVQVDPLPARQADQAEQRRLDLDPLGDVQQRAAGPERRVERREGVGGGRDGVGQEVALEDLRMILRRRGQVDEDRPAELGRVGRSAGEALTCSSPVA